MTQTNTLSTHLSHLHDISFTNAFQRAESRSLVGIRQQTNLHPTIPTTATTVTIHMVAIIDVFHGHVVLLLELP